MRNKKQIEREARQEQANRLAYIGTLASGLAHEIRSPLNAMKLNLDILREDLDAVVPARREDFSQRLGLIGREVDGLQALLTKFLNFAKPQTMELLPTDLNQLLNDVVQFVQPACKEQSIERSSRNFKKASIRFRSTSTNSGAA